MTKLSICIPTYNFGGFIGRTLDSILPNLAEGVEVVILDGGSTDDTAQVVADRQEGCPQIRYHQQGFRGGIDRDIAKVVALAKGDYCWLFSADDWMRAGAVEKILRAIRSGCDLYLCEHILCDFEMRPIKPYPIFAGIASPETFDLGNREQRERYFRHARTSEAFFSFLSGPIFRREVWMRAEDRAGSFYGTCWGIAGRLLSLAPEGLVVHYLAEALLYKRSENDSFSDHGLVRRVQISVEGLPGLVETIFGQGSPEAFHIRRVIRNECSLRYLLFMKMLTAAFPQQEDIRTLTALAGRLYGDAGWPNRCRYMVFRRMPVPVIRMLYFLKMRLTGRRPGLPADPLPANGCGA